MAHPRPPGADRSTRYQPRRRWPEACSWFGSDHRAFSPIILYLPAGDRHDPLALSNPGGRRRRDHRLRLYPLLRWRRRRLPVGGGGGGRRTPQPADQPVRVHRRWTELRRRRPGRSGRRQLRGAGAGRLGPVLHRVRGARRAVVLRRARVSRDVPPDRPERAGLPHLLGLRRHRAVGSGGARRGLPGPRRLRLLAPQRLRRDLLRGGSPRRRLQRHRRVRRVRAGAHHPGLLRQRGLPDRLRVHGEPGRLPAAARLWRRWRRLPRGVLRPVRAVGRFVRRDRLRPRLPLRRGVQRHRHWLGRLGRRGRAGRSWHLHRDLRPRRDLLPARVPAQQRVRRGLPAVRLPRRPGVRPAVPLRVPARPTRRVRGLRVWPGRALRGALPPVRSAPRRLGLRERVRAVLRAEPADHLRGHFLRPGLALRAAVRRRPEPAAGHDGRVHRDLRSRRRRRLRRDRLRPGHPLRRELPADAVRRPGRLPGAVPRRVRARRSRHLRRGRLRDAAAGVPARHPARRVRGLLHRLLHPSRSLRRHADPV